MKLEIARLKRRCSRLAVAWLSIVLSSVVLAQSTAPPVPSPNPAPVAAAPAPAAAARRTMTVEERLQKLEEVNQRLLEQNQQLTHELKALTEKVNAPDSPGAQRRIIPVVQPPAGGANTLTTQPTTGSAFGGGELMAPPSGPAPPGPGPGANILFTQPMSGSAFGGGELMAAPSGPEPPGIGGVGPNVLRGVPSAAAAAGGGDLISFDERDTRGIEATGRFGRRFVNNGLWFSSPNRNFQFHPGGQFQLDTTWFNAGNTVQFGPRGIGKLRDGTDPRRIRLRVEGAMYENTLYNFEIEFANSVLQQAGTTGPFGPLTSTFNTPAAMSPTPTEVFIAQRNIPIIGNIRIGNQKEPFGFEQLCSTRFLNFMERSFNNDAFYSGLTQGYKPGVMAFSTAFDLRMTWAAGVFKNVTNPWDFQVGGGDWAETMRVTGLLLYEDEGRKVMHLGITGRNSGYDNGTSQFRVRGPERSGLNQDWDNYANTGAFHASGGQQDINLESVNVFGSWTIDAEYDFHFDQNAFLGGANGTRQTSVGTLFYSGGYVEVMYFLTGEHRAYIRQSGLYDRIVPRQNAFWIRGADGKRNEHGWGAWQVGLRYNYLNLNDKGINGGVLNDITLGLNWFLHPNAKLQFNYSITDRHSPASPGMPIGQSDGVIQGFGMRLAMDF